MNILFGIGLTWVSRRWVKRTLFRLSKVPQNMKMSQHSCFRFLVVACLFDTLFDIIL